MRKHLKPLVGTMAVLITAAQLPAIAAYADMNDAAPSETIAQESTAAFSVQTEKEVSPQGVLTMGSSFSVSGTVSSDSLIARAYGGIYTDGGEQPRLNNRLLHSLPSLEVHPPSVKRCVFPCTRTYQHG